MKVKRLDANFRDLKARLTRLKSEQRALEARMRRDRVAPRSAAFLEKIEKLDLRDLRKVDPGQRLRLVQSSRGIHAFLCKNTANLRDRLTFATARNR